MPEEQQTTPIADNTVPVQPQSQIPSVAPAGPANNPGQTMAIVGLVFAFLPLQLVGLILSIIAKTKAVKGTSANTIALLGIIFNSIIGLIGAGMFIVLALAALGGVQNAATADAFLIAVQNGEIEKAASYTDEPDNAGTKTFLKAAAAKLGSRHDQIDSATKGDLHGYAYELSGGSSKYARVSIANKDGKRYVYELVYGTEKIGATPREQEGFGSSTGGSEAESSSSALGESSGEATTTQQCVSSADIARVPSLTDYSGSDASLFFEKYIFFLPDSLNYSFTATSGDLDEVATYIKSLGNKSFSVEIQGEVATDRSTVAAINFANQRSQKIQNELVSRGVDASKLTMLPANTTNTKSNLDKESISRVVSIFIRKGC